jgi:RHS repeat-associated protein
VSALENETPDTTLLPLRIRGRVLYVNGTVVDHPLGIIRFAYEEFNDGSKPRYTPGPFLTVPHYTWRGAAEFATYADGSSRMCQTGSTLNCLQSAWPPEDAYQGRRFSIAWPEWSWLGTSLEGKTEGSGLQYKRNRYYDPSTGRFTQEDPAGLAGGLDAYGFAGSDPVNFSDPFGLKPCQDASGKKIDCPQPDGGPPVTLPGGRKWKPADGPSTPDKDGKTRGSRWVPTDPLPGGVPQPGASWDSDLGHWDVDNLPGSLPGKKGRRRFDENGREVTHDGDPIGDQQQEPFTPAQVREGVQAGAGAMLLEELIQFITTLVESLPVVL